MNSMKRKNYFGFTLVEILVTISIIAVLSTLSMATLKYAKDQANLTKARSDIAELVTAIKFLEHDTKEWPGHIAVDEINTASKEIWDFRVPLAGLRVTDGNYPNWDGPYMGNIPIDPWENDYFWDPDYEIDGEKFVVVGSFGPNRVGQNVYDSDNVIKVLR